MRDRAFTLVESMIAAALGAVVVTTAFAAFRVATQSSAVANRLSTENALIRAGLHEAHRELDLWLSFDDPDASAHQTLRTAGLPFSPLPARSGTPGGEDERGFDPVYRFPAHDPRTWYHGDIGEHDEPRAYEQVFGRYALFGCVDASPTFSVTPEGKGFAAARPVKHTWLYNQLAMIVAGFGYYGFTEYFPANQVYVPYLSFAAGTTTNGGMPFELDRPNGVFTNYDGSVAYPRGLFLLSFGSSFAMPRTTGRWTDVAGIGGAARRYYQTSYFSSSASDQGRTASGDYQGFLDQSENGWTPLALAPATWPHVEVRAQRFVKDARHVALVRVRWTSPITGAEGEINFTGFGTSLRGARQQRKPSGGWARWDDVGTGNDATLDGTP